MLDGVYARTPQGALRFHALPPPEDAEVARQSSAYVLALKIWEVAKDLVIAHPAGETLEYVAHG